MKRTPEKFTKAKEKQKELSDEELDNVSGGGCGDERPEPIFSAGDYVRRNGSEFVWEIKEVINYTKYGYEYRITKVNDTVFASEYESNLSRQ